MAAKVDRRKLRKEQRHLHDEIIDNREELENIKSEKFDAVNSKNEELFHLTDHSREALQDSLNVKELVRAVKVQTSFLDDVSIRYDFNSFAAAIQNVYHRPGERNFSWDMFGKSTGVLSHRRCNFSVMLGPIAKEAKEKAVRGPRARVVESNDPSCPEEVEHKARVPGQDVDAKSLETEATNKRIINLIHTLREGGRGAKTMPLSSFPSMNKKQSTENMNSIDLLDLLVDRTDPVQTVENFFDFAFLLKEKRAMETLNPSNGLPYLVQVDPGTMKEHWGNETKQMVLTMNIPDLRTIAELLSSETNSSSSSKRKRTTDDDETPHCPLHRSDPIYLAKDIKQQIDLITEKAKKHVVATTPKKKQSNGVTAAHAHSSTQESPNDQDEAHGKKKAVAAAPVRKKKESATKTVKAERASRNKSRNLQVSDDEEEEQREEEDFVPSQKRGRQGR